MIASTSQPHQNTHLYDISSVHYQIRVGKINYIYTPLVTATFMNIVSSAITQPDTQHESIKIPDQIVVDNSEITEIPTL